MKKKFPRFLTHLYLFTILFIFCVIHTRQLFAQYQVSTWSNFEDGTFPENLEMAHDAASDNVSVFNYKDPSAPKGIIDGIAQTECGAYGLKFKIDEGKKYLKVINQFSLDRKNLGTSGKALFQADFFIPEDLSTVPASMAVLAVKQTETGESAAFRFYRLGILKGERIFFSFTNNTGEPSIYKQQKFSTLNMKKGGWHRIQIIFQGKDKIICAFDGQPTSFSPIIEPTLGVVRPGLMVAGVVEESPLHCIVDNLSIQWSAEDVPLPESPWITGQSDGYAANNAISAEPGAFHWFASPEDAWKESQLSKRPILILFYTPKAKAWKLLEDIFQKNASAKALLKRFTLLKMNLNQLQGGTVAQQFQVFRVPCFLVMGLDGKVKFKEIFMKNSSWEQFSKKLEANLNP
jgi:hypothetical protein